MISPVLNSTSLAVPKWRKYVKCFGSIHLHSNEVISDHLTFLTLVQKLKIGSRKLLIL